jgi:hypothetical protein
MKIIVIAENNEMDAYQNYIQALVNDGKEDIAPVAEVMLESMKQARRHPEHVESESDGFGTFEVQTTEYGGCEFRAEYDSETMAKMIDIMTNHRDIVEKIVRFIWNGVSLMGGIKTLFKEMIGIVDKKKEAYALEQKAQEKEVVW